MSGRWPRAYPSLAATAVFKAQAQDFQVDEEPLAVQSPDAAAEAAGEHLYLLVEKTDLGTRDAADALAGACGVAPQTVGYAGMKDKRAVTRQWFSVPTPRWTPELQQACQERGGLRVIGHQRRSRKLRRGDLAGNRFMIRLRDVTGEGWRERLALIATQGVPNYFGPQRFGQDNLAQALAWLPQRRRRRISRFKQGLYLSVLRSYLFNEVLAARVADATWQTVLPGDVVLCGAVDAASGPLWGRGRSAAEGAPAEVEARALAPHVELCEQLEHAGVTQGRRNLVLWPRDLTWDVEQDTVVLRFALPAGGYATTVLGEVFDLVEGSHGRV